MAKKLVKKKKLRVFRLFLGLLILAFFALLIYLLLHTKIKNIIIKNTNYLNDDYIIEKWHKQIISKVTDKVYGKDELHLYTKKVYLDERNLLNNIIRIQESKQKLCTITEQNIKDIENELRDGQRGVSGTGGNGKKKLLTI